MLAITYAVPAVAQTDEPAKTTLLAQATEKEKAKDKDIEKEKGKDKDKG